MWMMPETVKVFMATSPADMRKSYNGLSILVESIIETPVTERICPVCQLPKELKDLRAGPNAITLCSKC